MSEMHIVAILILIFNLGFYIATKQVETHLISIKRNGLLHVLTRMLMLEIINCLSSIVLQSCWRWEESYKAAADVTTQKIAGIVNVQNWEMYFGPFVGRALYCQDNPPDINRSRE
ncbi:3478_t:CDS:2 [Funneliformis mosseae]|uniref:3478_t:CDS:1 n=1 Tax=Funneliformis mosseae TaxID=27381 RepID=A0A9N9HIT5_FUNMO|nr:3478_t:CDS:2 [Funneliformis mosseae]